MNEELIYTSSYSCIMRKIVLFHLHRPERSLVFMMWLCCFIPPFFLPYSLTIYLN